MNVIRILPAIGALFTLSAVAQPQDPPFVESALEGVRTTSGAAQKNYILEVNGQGLAVADFDGGGTLDLVVVDGSTLERVAAGQPGLPPRLFLNRAGSFEPAGEDWAMGGGRFGTGAACADFDGDGHVDLVVLEWGADRLFRNRGGKGFEEIEDSGFKGSRWGTSGAFLDYDLDGFLDLCVVNYLAFDPERIASRTSGACRWKGHAVMCGPEGLTPVHDQLYRNEDGKRFRDVTVISGFRPERAGFGLGVVTSDFDRDGDTDLYVTNDSTPNHLWENLRTSSEGGETWREIGLRSGTALDAAGKEQAGMGIAVGDLNLDGADDFFVTNFSGESNALYLSMSGSMSGARRGARWRDRSAPAGLSKSSLTRLGWGAFCEDFDLDGDLDLVSLNGHVYPQADNPGTDSSYAQEDSFLRNLGYDTERKRLRLQHERLSAAPAVVSRAGVAVDIEGNGLVDIIALELDGSVRILRNAKSSEGAGHWVLVRLQGRAPNLQGIGARVRLEWEGGFLEREMRTAGGYQSSVPAEIHFGLGARAEIDRAIVTWPGGEQSIHAGDEEIGLDRLVLLRQPPPR